MKTLLTYLALATLAHSATGDFLFQKKTSTGYAPVLITPENGKVISWSGGAPVNVTAGSDLTAGPVRSTGGTSSIADAALSIAKTSGLQTALDAKAPLASPALTGTPTINGMPVGTAATADSSTSGGLNKVLQNDGSGNLLMGPVDNRNYTINPSTGYLTSGFGGVGNIVFPDQQGLLWKDPATGGNVFTMRHWRGHDSMNGETIFESAWRMAFISAGPIQFGNNASSRNAQYLHMVSGATTTTDPLRASKAISMQTLTRTPGALVNAGSFVTNSSYKIATIGSTPTPFTAIGAASNTVGTYFTASGPGTGNGTAYLAPETSNHIQFQAVPLDDSGTNSALRFYRNAEVDGSTGGVGATTGDISGTIIGELGRDGFWSNGTTPALATLDASGATVTWTVSKYLNRQFAKVTLGGNRTLALGGTVLPGMQGVLFVVQDGTGSRTLTLPGGSKTANGTNAALALSSTAGAVDRVEWDYDGVNTFWRVTLNYTGPLDADAQAFITAASISDSTQQTAINTLVLGLKAASIWTKFVALYPFVGGNATSHSKDLKGAYNITWAGGALTHDANGITGNVAGSGYGNTGLAPSTFGSSSSQFLYVYNKTTLPTAGGKFISSGTSGGYRSHLFHYTTGSAYLGVTINTNDPVGRFYGAVSDFKGHFAANITDASNSVLWFNAVTSSFGSTALGRSTQPYYILAENFSGSASNFSNANLAFAAAGQSLTAGEWVTFKTLIDAFQSSLTRSN